jgi:hypothetical protein
MNTSLYRKLYAGAWIGRTELLLNGHTEDAPKDSILLMHGSGFQESKFRDPVPPADMLAALEPLTKVDLDLGCVDLRHFHRAEHGSQALERILIRFVRADSANRRLGVVLQEKVCPFAKSELFALADDVQGVVVSDLKPFAKLTLSFLPVFCVR